MLQTSISERALSRGLLDVLIRAGLVATLVLFCFEIFHPFFDLVMWALILAVTIYPLQVRMRGRLGLSEGHVATLIIVLSIAIILVPAYLLGVAVFESVERAIDVVKDGTFRIPQPPDSVSGWPLVGQQFYAFWQQAATDLSGLLMKVAPQLKGFSVALLAKLAGLGTGLLVFVFALIIAGIIMSHGGTGTRRRAADRLAHRRARARRPHRRAVHRDHPRRCAGRGGHRLHPDDADRRGLHHQGELETRQFAKYPIWVVGPRKADWARGKTVSLAALRDQPLVLLTDTFSLTHKLRLAFLEARIEPRVVAQSGHWDFLASMAAAGLGTTFLPQPFLARLQDRDNLAVARLTEPAMDWALAHAWLPGRYLSHAARAWLSVCDEVLGGKAVSA